MSELTFDRMKEPVEELLVATKNKLEREWPRKYAVGFELLRDFVLGTVVVVTNNFKAATYLLANQPEDPRRRSEFVLAAPPLVRTMLDSVFSVVFMLEDPASRSTWYGKSMWKELLEWCKRWEPIYGTDPDWKEPFELAKEKMDFLARELGLDAADMADPRRIKYWPNPGGMKREAAGSNKELLTFLDDVFYGDLSALTHLSLDGLARQVRILMEPGEAERERQLSAVRSALAWRVIAFALALVSEIEIDMSLGLYPRLHEQWIRLREAGLATRELYDKQYSVRLPGMPLQV